MKEAYEQFVALCKKKFGWKDEEMNTWDELSNEQRAQFEGKYTFLIAMNDAAGAEERYEQQQQYS